MVLTTREGRALLPGSPSIAEGGRMKTIVVTYKGVVVKDVNSPFVKRAVAGDVVTVGDDDAALLIGMGRARAYEPPKDPPKPEPEKEAEREVAREPKREVQTAPPRPERKKE